MQRYTLDMGRPPEEEEDPTTAQLARLHKRVVQLKQAPCVDFGVWVPFWEAGAEAAEFSDVYPDRGWNLSDARAARSSKLPAMDGLLEGFQDSGNHVGHRVAVGAPELREDDRAAGGAVAGGLGLGLPGGGQGQSGAAGEDTPQLRCRPDRGQDHAG